MEGTKLVAGSTILERAFHVDAFVVGAAPTFLGLLFGGSGVTRETYEARERSLVPVFDAALASLERTLSFGLVFVTAPHDVPFSRFADEPAEGERWDAHVRGELLPLVGERLPQLGGLPRYVMGYSGGAALALSGHHRDVACFGAGMLGADGLHGGLRRAPAWPEPLTLYYNLDDEVHGANREVVSALEAAGDAQAFQRLHGGHALGDYVANESFGGLVRRAARTVPRA